jgi:hypothetical protein
MDGQNNRDHINFLDATRLFGLGDPCQAYQEGNRNTLPKQMWSAMVLQATPIVGWAYRVMALAWHRLFFSF